MRDFKTYEKNWCGVTYFLRYLGAEVEGQCKWYIWSKDVDLDQYDDTLWYTKEEAILTAQHSIFVSQNGKYDSLELTSYTEKECSNDWCDFTHEKGYCTCNDTMEK